MKWKFNSQLVLFVVFLLLSVTCLSQKTSQQTLETVIPDFRIEGRDLSATLEVLAREYKVPIGFECSDLEYSTLNKLTLDFKQSSLEEVLNAIVKQKPDYYWEINDAVVNFVPTSSRNAIVSKLLQTKVASFDPNKNSTSVEVKEYITQLPEVKRLFVKKNPFNLNVYEGKPSIEKFPDNSLNLIKNAEIKFILNDLIKNSDSKFWYLRGLSDDLLILNF